MDPRTWYSIEGESALALNRAGESSLLATVCFVHPKINFTLMAAPIHCWVIVSMISPAPQDPFLLSHSSASLYLCAELLCARHFPLLNFILILIAQFSNLLKSSANTLIPPGSQQHLPVQHHQQTCTTALHSDHWWECWKGELTELSLGAHRLWQSTIHM